MGDLGTVSALTRGLYCNYSRLWKKLNNILTLASLWYIFVCARVRDCRKPPYSGRLEGEQYKKRRNKSAWPYHPVKDQHTLKPSPHLPSLLPSNLTPCHTIGCWPRGGGHLKSQWYQNESFVTFSTFKSFKIHFHQIRSTRSEFFIQSNPSRMRMAASKITHFPNKTVYEKELCLNWQYSQNGRIKVPGWLPVRFRSVHLIDTWQSHEAMGEDLLRAVKQCSWCW